jgi:D-sedoheptulose 7-phosphate isomerase
LTSHLTEAIVPRPLHDSRAYIDGFVAVLRRIDQAAVKRLAFLVFSAWRGRHTVFLCGNGGNAANAAHFATDLTKLTAPPEGPRLRAVALGESLSGLTAVANDIAYEQVFAEQLRGFLSPHDLVIGLSTSGSSPNVLRAIEYANEAGAVTIGITGLDGHKLEASARYPLVIGSSSVQQIEDATMLIGHLVCLQVRDLVLASVKARGDAGRDTPAQNPSGLWAGAQAPSPTAGPFAPPDDRPPATA